MDAKQGGKMEAEVRRFIDQEASAEELWFEMGRARTAEAIACGRWSDAQRAALEWSFGVSEQLGLPRTEVWKFFKRAIVARWFGQVESRKFSPGWSVEEALEYAESFSERAVRFSLFPSDIACHAKSFRLAWDQRERWREILTQADKTTAMEMFPEASSDRTICFRRATTMFGDDVCYEAGTGQAMFVFEQERGEHPVVSASKCGCEFEYSKVIPDRCRGQQLPDIETKLRRLVDLYDPALTLKCFGLCRTLGIDYVSIEGYFDAVSVRPPIVVDLDLPFDAVFMIPHD